MIPGAKAVESPLPQAHTITSLTKADTCEVVEDPADNKLKEIIGLLAYSRSACRTDRSGVRGCRYAKPERVEMNRLQIFEFGR